MGMDVVRGPAKTSFWCLAFLCTAELQELMSCRWYANHIPHYQCLECGCQLSSWSGHDI